MSFSTWARPSILLFMFPPYLQDGGIYSIVHPEVFHACNQGMIVYNHTQTQYCFWCPYCIDRIWDINLRPIELYTSSPDQWLVPPLYIPECYTDVGYISSLNVISSYTILCVVWANPVLFDLKSIKETLFHHLHSSAYQSNL